MAHLQHRFDINDIKLNDNKSLLIPVCLDNTVSDILSMIAENDENLKFYHQNGDIIISGACHQGTIRSVLDNTPIVSNHKLNKSAKLNNGNFEIQVTFSSKIESSITDFINLLCNNYNVESSKISISHFTPHNIPNWWRNMNEQTKHNFFGQTVENKENKSISSRHSKISTEGDEELAEVSETGKSATCSAFIYFKDKESIDTLICQQTQIWGMVINGERCRISTPPTQIILKNVPYNPCNPVRYSPYYTPSTKTLNEIQDDIKTIEQDPEGNVVPPMFKRIVDPHKAHISIGDEHEQYSVPYINNNGSNCKGLKAIYVQTTKFEHDHFGKSSIASRLAFEAPSICNKLHKNMNIAERSHLLMKYSDTINIGLPLIGGVIQYMLALIPTNDTDHGLSKFYDGHNFVAPFDVDRADKIDVIKNIPIVANKIKINIDDSWIDSDLDESIPYIWKHASCTYEDNKLQWYLDDDVNPYWITSKQITRKMDNPLFARMGYICVHSKRHRKVNIITHGIEKWNGHTPESLKDVIETNKLSQKKSGSIQEFNTNWDDNQDILSELGDWLEDEIEDNQSTTIAKAVSSKNIIDLQSLDTKDTTYENENDDNRFDDDDEEDLNYHNQWQQDRVFDIESGKRMMVYVNGKLYGFGDENKKAIILNKGWNHILIDFGFNDMNSGSFQIIDFNDNSEISDLSWRYSPPPMSLILQFNNHLNALKQYDKLKVAKAKRYGMRVELAEYDEHYLSNNTILQSEVMDTDDNDDDNSQQLNYMLQDDDDLIGSLMNTINGDHEIPLSDDLDLNQGQSAMVGCDRLLENFTNGIIENIHKSNIDFDGYQDAKDIDQATEKYQRILAEYTPSQMLQYDDKQDCNETELYSISLNVPSTLELLSGNIEFDQLHK